jgi:hypothetical protein
MSLLAIDRYAAGIRSIQAGSNVHQRGLSGAVLAEQGVHFALPKLESSTVEGYKLAEPFPDPRELEDSRHACSTFAS